MKRDNSYSFYPHPYPCCSMTAQPGKVCQLLLLNGNAHNLQTTVHQVYVGKWMTE